MVEDILQRNAVEILVHHLVQASPQRQGKTSVGSVTALGMEVQTGDRRDATLCQAENIADRILVRLLGKLLAALIAAVRVEKLRAVEHGNDLFQILF